MTPVDPERPRRRAFRLGRRTHEGIRSEVDEELRHHLEESVEELVREGWERKAAEEEARRRFGDLDETVDYCARESFRARYREGWTMWWDDLRQDLRYAFRALRRSPTYATVVTLTLGAGIAASTTVFSLMNPYFFRALPFPDSDALVQVGGVDPQEGWDGGRFSAPQIAELQERSRAFDELGGYYYGVVNLTDGEVATREMAAYMTGNLMGILGAQPLLGRTLTPEDTRGGEAAVVVIGEDLWESRFARDPDLLGRTITLDGRAVAVVGVMPRSFSFPFGTIRIWSPLAQDPVSTPRSVMGTLPVGRLETGWTPEAAASELTELHADMAVRFPDADGRYAAISVKPLREALNFAWDVLRTALFLLLGAVLLLLVIACVNVTSLTLARTTSRAREVSVRAALGASRERLVRQLLAEGFLLALAGGTLGAGLAYLATGLLNGLIPPDLYRVGDVTLDLRVLAFAGAVTLATPLVFSLTPALRFARKPLAAILRSGRTGDGRESLRGRRLLVVAEVALAIVLVTGTGLMVRSLQEVVAVDLGFAADRVLTVALWPSEDGYRDAGELQSFYDAVEERIARESGVLSVSTVSHLPLNHETIPTGYQLPGSAGAPMEEWPSALTSRADGGYFDAMGIPLVAGRTFTSTDGTDGNAVIISQGMADRLFPSGDAVGRSILHGRNGEPLTSTVVGVVGEVRYEDLTSPMRPHLYRPQEGTSSRRRFVVVRTQGDPSALSRAVRSAVREVDPAVAAEPRPARDVVRESTLLWAVSSTFMGAFGVLAILLAVMGVYGLIAFSVAQRRPEMGLRMALGADAATVQRSVVMEGLKLTGGGLVIGLGLGLATAGLARSVLFGVSILDPVALAAVAGIFLCVALAGSLIPARRAARVDPQEVLRAE